MTLRDLVAWVVGVLPAKYTVLYVNCLKNTLKAWEKSRYWLQYWKVNEKSGCTSLKKVRIGIKSVFYI